MIFIYYILLGIVQGIVEALPISSSGHLLVFNNLLTNYLGFKNVALSNTELLAIITNFGSLIAVIILYRNKIISILKDFFGYFKTKSKKQETNYKYGWNIILATIPAGIIGLIISKLKIFDAINNNIKIIGVTLIITGIFLFLIRKTNGKKTEKDMTLKDAIAVGLFQVLGLLPGISRSGSTIVGGLYKGLDRQTAFDFSFMLYIPISCATTLLGLKDLFGSNITPNEIMLFIISAVVAGIFTYFSVKWFRKIIKNGKLIYFSIYCFIVGLLIILFLLNHIKQLKLILGFQWNFLKEPLVLSTLAQD